jgi:regulator of sigma E protease
MQTIISTLLFLLSLGVLILIHELGHFVMAKAFHVYVREFSIGFGPVIFSWKKGETTYALKAFPLGGYVAMVGEEVNATDIQVPMNRSLLGISKPKRALIMSAGIVLNLVLAYVLFFASNWAFPQRSLFNPLTDKNQMVITETSVADLAGIDSGDTLEFTQGTIAVTTDEGVDTYYLYTSALQTLNDSLSDVIRFEKVVDENIIPYIVDSISDFVEFDLPVRTYTTATDYTERFVSIRLDAEASSDGFRLEPIGISFNVFLTNYSFLEALVKSGSDWVDGVLLIVNSVATLFQGRNLDQVGGIVAIFSTTASILINFGISYYIFIWALISVNLAVFNLLPFPGLDGWHLLVITIEGIFQREIPSRLKNVVSMIGFFILMSLMVILLIKDILALVLVV